MAKSFHACILICFLMSQALAAPPLHLKQTNNLFEIENFWEFLRIAVGMLSTAFFFNLAWGFNPKYRK